MMLSTQPYKGTRDFYPDDKRLQDYMFGVMRTVVKSFGYEEYDAPIIEPLDLYRSKTSEEIVNEQVYSFTDRGGREVAIRPEMTPTVSRMVAAKRQELSYPARLFSIPNVWRYERPQRGRMREHWQLNVDLFGEAGLAGDHEMIVVADSILKAFGAKPDMYEIRVNSRKLLNKRIEDAGPKKPANEIIRLIDGYDKMSPEDFRAKLADAVSRSDELFGFLSSGGDTEELKELKILCEESGISVKPHYSLARGFDYYDDIIFEVFDTNPENNRSMFGGGRYNGLVGLFGVEPVPTVGFGVGDVTLANFLETHGLVPAIKSDIDAVVVTIGDVYRNAQKLFASLRRMGLNIAVDATDRKLPGKLKHADKSGADYVIFVGQEDLDAEQYGLKNLKTGEEAKLSAERLVTTIKDYRKQ